MTECLCIAKMPYYLTTKIIETNHIITGSDSSVTVGIACPFQHQNEASLNVNENFAVLSRQPYSMKNPT